MSAIRRAHQLPHDRHWRRDVFASVAVMSSLRTGGAPTRLRLPAVTAMGELPSSRHPMARLLGGFGWMAARAARSDVRHTSLPGALPEHVGRFCNRAVTAERYPNKAGLMDSLSHVPAES